MAAPVADLQLLRTVNDTAGFNRWAAFEVVRAERGLVEKGQAFVASAQVVKAGRRQVFVRAELSAELDGSPTLIAAGETILVPTGVPK